MNSRSFGLPDVITAMHSKKYKDGKVKVVAGESYIELVKFSKNGVEIESVISYGNSEKKESTHFDDQMEMYLNFKTKKWLLIGIRFTKTLREYIIPDDYFEKSL